ncbi:hypothetical protein HOLleu_15194 [Holothuria leucospilota]|uniref:LRAT domain-containing protein n=1 Tax=Holothuria leucospilota TaxID=206669 RepID=A0A9Q1C9Y0_HOLLE|nr:hypothetical protein HOLleu_15194 [Holothuria leucospilota]
MGGVNPQYYLYRDARNYTSRSIPLSSTTNQPIRCTEQASTLCFGSQCWPCCTSFCRSCCLPCCYDRNYFGCCCQREPQQYDCNGKLRIYGPTENIVGLYCKRCHSEWLEENFCQENRLDTVRGHDLIIEEKRYILKVKTEPHPLAFSHCVEMVSGVRVPVRQEEVNRLRVGDHITWHRDYGMWHHAIISEIRGDGDGLSFVVVQWYGDDFCDKGAAEIELGTLCDIFSANGSLYKIVYDNNVILQNPPDLVLHRAFSRMDERGYDLLSDNCEHFASYCKTGRHRSGQEKWLKICKLPQFVMTAVIQTAVISVLFIALDKNDPRIVWPLLEKLFEIFLSCKELLIFTVMSAIEVIILLIIMFWRIWLSNYCGLCGRKRQTITDICRRVGEDTTESTVVVLFFALGSVISYGAGQIRGMPLSGDIIIAVLVNLLLGVVGRFVGLLFGHCCCRRTFCRNCEHLGKLLRLTDEETGSDSIQGTPSVSIENSYRAESSYETDDRVATEHTNLLPHYDYNSYYHSI